MNELLNRIQSALGDAYAVETELPAGGMSRIFLALEASLNRKVVVKVLPPEFSSEVSAARFRQEVELLARLQHPHILPILATGSRGDLLYYVMPFVAGESLRHRLATEGALPIEDAVRILSEMADALGFAHTAGVLHRDIKPENILLEGRHAVLADFGVARALQASAGGDRLTATGLSVGTPGYMSPEQMAGDAVDARAEVYALGVVGYEMLTGKPPFEGPTAQAVLTAHLTTPPLPVREVRPEVPVHVSQAIARALSKQPEQRFLNAAEFGEALAGHHAHADAPVLGRGTTRRRVLLAVAAAAVLASAAWLITRAGAGRIDATTLLALRTAADSGRLDQLAFLADSAGIPADHRSLRGLGAVVTGSLTIATDPAGVEVELSRVGPIETFAGRPFRAVGRTPIQNLALIAGEYSIRLVAPGRPPRYVLAFVAPGATASVEASLPPADSAVDGFVPVEAGPSPVGGAVEPYLIGRHEVTNEEYLRFVAAGGYRDPAYWPATLLVAARRIPWADAIETFVDRSGLPGPRTWESGKYPAGKADHPVAGVSWYEASAYARWSSGSLPTVAEWWRAAHGDTLQVFPWGVEGASAHRRANLEGVSTTPVGQFPLGVSRFGVMDMAGNVREWLADSVPDSPRRLAAGGSWQDPLYMAMADAAHTERFDPAYSGDGLGFRIVRRRSP